MLVINFRLVVTDIEKIWYSICFQRERLWLWYPQKDCAF